MIDSAPETQAHIDVVADYLGDAGQKLWDRSYVHDQSKLEEPEKHYFDEFTPKLAELEYGSEEYRECLRQMKPAIEHHYAHNSHHPEHYSNSINGMSLLDLIEMLCDWKAASLRTKQRMDGDEYLKQSFRESLDYNKERFDISDQLHEIIVNTAKELGFI